MRDGIAILGMGCRYPGGAHSPEALWELVCAGRNGISDRRRLGRPAGVLDDLAGFDAAFFGIASGEAAEMDPAQRLLLEVTFEAIERAGLDLDALSGTATGVYLGLAISDYGRRHLLAPSGPLTPWSGTGTFLSVAAGRIAYLLGTHGPAISVDTACSSSLVSLHLAASALRAGECDLALAGGVNVVLSARVTAWLASLGALSERGQSRPFDASADGYVRGEGAGMVVLRRLSDAIADGDPILAVIAGSAVNQDGRTNGLTAPSGAAQQAVIRAALRSAGLQPGDISYVETHGTGTPLGDPVEIGALRAVYGEIDHPLGLGAVKGNLGHTETAAGVAGVIKAVEALQRGIWPPIAGLSAPNPRLGALGPLVLPTEPIPWPGDSPRVAAVSAFGMSGTNAHLILSAPPPRPAPGAVEAPAWGEG
ncbi:MAG TPA: polyketide synthase, partial [Deltaproteobacteria bacterium]|nr:polyketide synthase [Deltaproteobacteria bacterium]